MRLKEFFRPTVAKIIIALLMLSFTPILLIEGVSIGCEDYESDVCIQSGSFIQPYQVFVYGLPFIAVLILSYFFYLAIIIDYVFSCTLVHIYKKIKSKK